MLFNYKTIDTEGKSHDGTIEAVSVDVAINSLQRRGLVISTINASGEEKGLLKKEFALFRHVSNKDVVILSRQMATLFEAQVSALRVFRLLGEETQNPILRKVLSEIAQDLQGGSAISKALGKHPEVFSDFYVNMVLSGEESGKLDQTFNYLADYLDRSYEITSKAKNALIYPAFVVVTFITVMILMLTLVIPRISSILLESGQPIPSYTKVVIGFSNFFINYGVFLVIILIVGGFFLSKFLKTEAGKLSFDKFKINLPYIGTLYRKLYLSRLADNMNTMILSGISMIRVIDITSTVVDNLVFKNALAEASNAVKGGSSVGDAFSKSGEIPGIMIQMIKVGEETGELGNILKTLSRFYQREVITAVDTLVDLIEPAMVVALGLGVGFLLVSVLVPIYNISSAIN